jgi:hypothetical protein
LIEYGWPENEDADLASVNLPVSRLSKI